ncbi:hypothetical protein ACFY2M_17210 [Streptomyces sp. NPDC001276]|uniref:hypothetical protein n=1 Tax=Streptomyces sp. NPDC001276 TaxID=3364555 RepID=UPI00367CA17C
MCQLPGLVLPEWSRVEVGPTHVSPEALGDVQRAREFNERLPERWMDRFIDTVYAMRQALAELEPYYVVAWNSDRFMLTEDELINIGVSFGRLVELLRD